MTRRSLVCAPASLIFAAAETTRASFLRLIHRPIVPLSPVTRSLPTSGELERQHFSFASEAHERVPGVMVKPKTARPLPVVVVLHGTGKNKEEQTPLLERLARRGFLAVAIDGRYHGERAKGGDSDYTDAMLRAYRGAKEYPFLYDTVWDIMRLVDYLGTRPDVDARRIGMIGFSKGGMELYLAAAADPRIAVAVPCIGVQSFRWAMEHDAWQSRVGTFQAAIDAAAQDAGKNKVDASFLRVFYDRVVPGIYSDFDGPRMVPLIAPRPLLVINGDSDARTPMPGLRECLSAAEQAYASAADRYQAVLQPNTGHKVNPESLTLAVDWFEKWLVQDPNSSRSRRD